MKKSDARLLPPVVQQKVRHDAVDMFLKGATITDISKHMGVSRQAIYTWLKKHSLSGLQNVDLAPLGVGQVMVAFGHNRISIVFLYQNHI